MNRLLATSALFLSVCALIATFLLWREVHAARLEVSQHPIHARLSDEQLATVQGYVNYVHSAFAAGTIPRAEVLVAEQLLNKARYLHGDTSEEEWHRLSLAGESEFSDLLIRRIKAGAGTSADLTIHYDDLLESSR